MNKPARLPYGLVGVAAVIAIFVAPAGAQPRGVRRNFLGMHNLKGGGVTPFQTGMDWTKSLVGSGFIMDWVTDFAPGAPDHWIEEAMRRGLVPCVRVQQCQGTSGCAPSVGYSVNVAAQILAWKVAHPEYANRYVYLQLWNEPGDSRDFVPMTVYADYLVAAYAGIRKVEREYAAAHPNLDLSGTLQVMTPGQNGDDGWADAFNHNPQAKFSFDVWGTHPYPDMTPPWYNVHDGDLPANSLKTIDSYIQDLDETARAHRGVPGRRGFPVMITETNYGHFVGHSTVGWPKLTQEARAPFTVDAFFRRWYQWPEVLAVHPFLLNNVKWPAFEFVKSWTSQDVEEPFGILEPANPYPVYAALRQERQRVQAGGGLAPAELSRYRGPVGSIRGRVTRSGTGAPVPYATLATEGYEFGHLTLFDGIYEVHDVPVGTYELSFQKASYLPASQTIVVVQDQTTVADFEVTFLGKTLETLYHVTDRNGGCDENCPNLNASDHWQSFVTGPETAFIKFASSHVHGDGLTMKYTLHQGGPAGPQVGPSMFATNPNAAGDQMTGWEWPDGQEPAVEPNTRYWLRFQRADGRAIYTYASNQNPYAHGNSSSSGNVDFYGAIYGLTREVNARTGAIDGTVTDNRGTAISGATVIRRPGGVATTTSVDGRFRMAGVSVGVYSVTASKPGYEPQTVSDQAVAENLTTRIDFALAALPAVISLSKSSSSPRTTQGGSAASDSFTILNSGGGVLEYTVSDDATWISVSPESGTSTGEADTVVVTYNTAALDAGTYQAAVSVSAPGAANHPQTVRVALTVDAVGGGGAIAEDFESMPVWSSSHDASWGGAALFRLATVGSPGSALRAERSSGGSSSRVIVYDIRPQTSYTLSVLAKCPALPSSYWAEVAFRLGQHTSSDFDVNSGSWTMVRKFSASGALGTSNGNGNVWTQYSFTFQSASATRLSLGFKLGSSGAGLSAEWDTVRIAPVP